MLSGDGLLFSEQEFIKRFAGIRVWKRGDRRAPHKPLLILFMLGGCSEEARMVSYSEVVEPLQRLLDDFARPGVHRGISFIILQATVFGSFHCGSF